VSSLERKAWTRVFFAEKVYQLMFVDRVRIKVSAGHGGHGCISFRREKYVPLGGPDGGDGGKGGDVLLIATHNQQSLQDFYYLAHYEGGRGGGGMGKKRHGANGADRILNVPVGTIVRDRDSGETFADLSSDGQVYIAARGGRGGLGNVHFKNSRRQAPRIATEGKPGEEFFLELELKILADVGLVGFPNAGKSTLLRAVSDARPKTGPYPFTTVHANVGVVEFDDYYRLRIADIPGLIAGAHANVGLGHAFLRHIERSRVLVYILDTAGLDGRLPWDDYDVLRQELALHNAELLTRQSLVLANKMDLPAAQENFAELQQRLAPVPVIGVSALTAENMHPIVLRLRQIVEAVNASEAAAEAAAAAALAAKAAEAEARAAAAVAAEIAAEIAAADTDDAP